MSCRYPSLLSGCGVCQRPLLLVTSLEPLSVCRVQAQHAETGGPLFRTAQYRIRVMVRRSNHSRMHQGGRDRACRLAVEYIRVTVQAGCRIPAGISLPSRVPLPCIRVTVQADPTCTLKARPGPARRCPSRSTQPPLGTAGCSRRPRPRCRRRTPPRSPSHRRRTPPRTPSPTSSLLPRRSPPHRPAATRSRPRTRTRLQPLTPRTRSGSGRSRYPPDTCHWCRLRRSRPPAPA